MANRSSWGNKVLPPLFRWFFASLAIGWIVGYNVLGLERGALAGFDVAALVFLIRTASSFRRTTGELREIAAHNDANRVQLLVLSFVLTLVILAAVVAMLSGHGKPTPLDKGLIAGSLVMVWLFANTVYTLHYAHLYYLRGDGGKDSAGLDFPKTGDPDFADFVYFAFTLGVAVQTSDVQITSSHFRKVVTAHCVAGFFFNLGVLALTINVLASS